MTMLLSEQGNSVAITDRINVIYPCHLLQEAAGIRGLPETEEKKTRVQV